MIEQATELQTRMICGQMWLGMVQDIFAEAWCKTHPGGKFSEIRDELEEDMKMLQRKYFNLSPNASYGLGYDKYADTLWDIHKCCEHARFVAMPKERQEALRWCVMADTPMAFGEEELIKVKEIKSS